MSTRPTWVVVSYTMLPNGSEHRLVQALLADGYDVAFCGMPPRGASRWRAEQMQPGSQAPAVPTDDPRRDPPVREVRSALDVRRLAWKPAKSGCREVVLAGYDPVTFLEAMAVFHSAPLRKRANAVRFVDWSAQRLQHPATAAAYRLATRGALRLADILAAISPTAAEALASAGGRFSDMLVLVNQPLQMGTSRDWEERPASVAHVGGLSEQQGVDVLLGAAEFLGRNGIPLDIVGDGPANRRVADTVSGLPGVRFHRLLDDVASLGEELQKTRVGWALYGPGFAMHHYNDPLNINHYLAAEMGVVSTLPTSVPDGVISTARLEVASLVEATRRALPRPSVPDPSRHPLLAEATRSLARFESAAGAVR